MQDYKHHIKETLRLGYPVMIAYAGYMLMNIVDSAMVGQVGKVPLAASSAGHALYFLFLVFGLNFSSIVSPLVAIAEGAGSERKAGILFHHSLFLNTLLGILLSAVTIISAEFIIYLNQPEPVIQPAISYMQLLGISIIPIMIFQTYKQFIEGLSITKPTMIAVLSANIVNAAVNYVLIYGNYGFPELGLDGAGIATILSRTFMAAVLIAYCLSAKRLKQYQLKPTIFKPVKSMIVRIIKLGLPAGFQSFFETSVFSFSAVMVGWIGTAQLAAHQIALSLASGSFLMVLGISSAAAVRVGNQVGRQDISQTRKAGFAALLLSTVFMTISGLIFILFKAPLVRLFIDNSEVIYYAEMLMVIAAVFQIFDGLQATGLGVLRGLTDVTFPSILAILSYWMVGMPVAYIAAFTLGIGVEGIWYGFVAGLGMMSLLLLLRFHRQSRKIIPLSKDSPAG